jgi:cold shock CspA family protein
VWNALDVKSHGTLIRWNDDRGFGFIAPAGGGPELFVHISAFPRGGARPQIGELISFETEAGTDGRQRAVRIMRPAKRAEGTRRQPRSKPVQRHEWLSRVLSLLMFGGIGVYLYQRFSGHHAPVSPAPVSRQLSDSTPLPSACDGRTRCPQMRSCEEAKFFLANCPGTKMDGDHDGVPCEEQWCN